jgi:metal-responsive CopG/Arc/MetJ family transcriptional regulator
MKTAVSIPDTLFEEADQVAKRLRFSRSELYAKALTKFVRELRTKDITERLNEVYGEEDGAIDSALAQMQYHSLSQEKW